MSPYRLPHPDDLPEGFFKEELAMGDKCEICLGKGGFEEQYDGSWLPCECPECGAVPPAGATLPEPPK